MNRRTFTFTALLALAAARSHAQPGEGPLTIVVPFPPGDALDSTARAIADAVATLMKVPVIVDNKPGAGGAVAADAVARSGGPTTFLLGTTAMMGITPFVRKVPYAPADFAPVARIATINSVIAVQASSPARTLREFVALAQQNPGKFSYASPGDGTGIHLQMEALQKVLGIKLLHVPYKGMAPALTDFLGGRIDVYYEAAVMPYIKSGHARGLALVGSSRLADLPDVPSTHELAVPFEEGGWFGIFAPRSVSPQLAQRLSAALRVATARPDIGSRLPMGVRASYADAASLAGQIQADQTLYRKLISELNIKLD